MTTIYIMEEHDQLLELWRAQQARSLDILHIDFHCDMRGLLVDRSRQRAYRVWDMNPSVGQGNFITHAIFEGRVRSVRWVHDTPGGRLYDVGTIKYTSDQTALPYRMLIALGILHPVPFEYTVQHYEEWAGPLDGEHLDIDWDFFASTAYSYDSIPARVDSYFDKECRVVPRAIYVCYSPDFSHPSRAQFLEFGDRMARSFKADVVKLEPKPGETVTQPYYRKYMPVALFRLMRRFYYGISLALRRHGVY